jgi:hypothetical protein
VNGALRIATTLLLLLVAVASAAACSTFDPAVGPLQVADSGASASTCALPANGYAASYGAPTGAAAAAAFCSVDGGTIGGPCDTCEAASCCADRVACYSDHTCACGDEALDACTSSLSGDAGAAESLACWSAFAATGSIAQTRYACLRTWCSEVCGIAN